VGRIIAQRSHILLLTARVLESAHEEPRLQYYMPHVQSAAPLCVLVLLHAAVEVRWISRAQASAEESSPVVPEELVVIAHVAVALICSPGAVPGVTVVAVSGTTGRRTRRMARKPNGDRHASSPGFVGIAVAPVVVLAVVVPMRDRDLEAHVMPEPSLPVQRLEVLDVLEHGPLRVSGNRAEK